MEFDEHTLQALERVAPARSRRRSEFIRKAVQKALWELQERSTAEAYARSPDSEPILFDPAAWDDSPKPIPRKSRAVARGSAKTARSKHRKKTRG